MSCTAVHPIDIFMMMHDDRTASDIIIGVWQATNHKGNSEPEFSLPK